MRKLGRVGLGPWVVLVAALLLGRAIAGCDMDRSELQCEEAVARILSCCDVDALPGVACSHYEGGCGEIFPEIGLDESRCIRDASCGDLEARGLCDWARDPASYLPIPSACP